MVAIPLASEAVALTDILPFVGTVDPFTGDVMETTGGTVSFGNGVGVTIVVGMGVPVAGIAVGVGVDVAVGVGDATGLTMMALLVVVMVKTVLSSATSCETADVIPTVVGVFGVVVLAPN